MERFIKLQIMLLLVPIVPVSPKVSYRNTRLAPPRPSLLSLPSLVIVFRNPDRKKVSVKYGRPSHEIAFISKAESYMKKLSMNLHVRWIPVELKHNNILLLTQNHILMT